MSPRNRSIFGIGGLNRSTSGGTAGGARRRRDRTGRRPSRPAAFAPESLESRIALAVDAFAQQPFTATLVDPLIGTAPRGTIPGWAVVIADSSDDLYLQQVATVPQSLLYADNGGFVGGGSVGGVNALQNIYVTNGERRTDLGVSQDNGPVYAFNLDDRREVTTRYIVEQDGVNIVDGVLEYTQADGVRTRWTFNGGPDGQTPQLLTGPGVGATPAGVYIVPTAISFREPSAVNGQSHLELTWRTAPVGAVPPDAPFLSPFSSNPVISRISYTYFDETTFDGNQPAIPKTEYNILPSTRALRVSNVLQPTTFTLPQATGAGSLGVIPGTLSGTMYFSGGAYPFRIDAFNGNRLVFSGGQTTAAVVLGDEYLLQTGGLKPKVAYGAFDADSGVISLYFASPEVGLNNTFVEQDPGYVSLDVSYGVYAQGQESRSVTVFAGQDITRQFDVDLLVPGSTINIDSPIVIDPSLAGGDISLRATNINLAAKVSSNDRLDIGPSVASRAPTIRTGLASSEIFAGEVVNVFSPSGLEGVGYDPDRPPTVTIVGPNGEVNAVLGTVTVDRNPASPTFGQVTAITVQNPGSGYDNVAPFTSAFPTITIAPPPAGVGAATATAVAVLDAQGSVTGVTITSGGAGYAASAANPVATIFRPQAEATAIVDAAGRLAGFTVTHRGVGYTSRPAVTVAAPVAVASAEIGAVTLTGDGVTGIAVAAAGYGYQAPPRVWIQPPPRESGGTRATAEAVLDSEGRVVSIVVTDAGSGYESTPEVRIMAPIPVARTEQVNFDATIAANVFDIRIGEELGTDLERGVLSVSPSASLAGKFFAGGVADSLFVQAEQADVVIEGTVWAKNQSYILQSRPSVVDLLPFVFTTTSPTSGADSGLVRGTTMAVTLANDSPTPSSGSVAFNEIDLRTSIDSLRVRAATSSGVAVSDPFPYEMRISEEDSITIEAVAASSFPMTLQADENLLFNAALLTASDVNILAGSLFTLSAPVSTTTGRITVSAENVTLENSVQVTAAAIDDTRDDVVIEATGGSIRLAGLVSAVNNVSLRQVNQAGANTIVYRNSEPVAITDNSTVSRDIFIADAFAFDDLDVAIEIAHPFVSDLSAVLVAPDGTRVRLFTRVGGAGDDFQGTIFDSEASTPITGGTPPFTGRFRPQDSLATLYGRSPRGTWRLEVTDSVPVDEGFINGFSLFFNSPQPVTGGISGSARVRADRLTIDAEGTVGEPALLPNNPLFYLPTNVNSLEARVGGSLSIDESSDLEVASIRAGDIVTLKVRGVDPVAGGSVAALRGQLIDVPRIDVSAPNGSIDIVNNSPTTIIVGNADALRRGGAVSMRAAGNVTIRSTGGASRGDMYVLDAPIAGQGGRAVRGLVASLPAFNYLPGSPGVVASSLTASVNGSLSVAGLTGLRVGDRLLLNLASAANQANGVYAITSLGSAASRWVLTRAADSDTANELPANSFVRVTDGTAAGRVYQLTYAATPSQPFSRSAVTVTETTLVTNIGSDDPRDRATFVVSTPAGTNAAAGSLGKMLRLRQVNDTSASALNPDQLMDFTFSSQVVTPIRLTEQLPLITKSFVIDGNSSYNPSGSPAVTRPRITVDGSRITQTRSGSAVTSTSVVNGFEFSGSGASAATVANMTVAGFTKGAAVQVTDSSDVLVNGMTLGTTELGLRVTNVHGVRVSGTATGTTVSGNTITASTKAGVRVEGAASGTVLVGNTIGNGDRDNNVGVEVDTASASRTRIGVMPVLPSATLATVTATMVSATSFTLPASYRASAGSLFAGLGVRGAGITPAGGSPAATIASVAINPTTGVTTVTISGGTVTASGSVTFANFVTTTANSATVTLPAAIRPDQVYIGQLVTGNSASGIPTGARVSGIIVDASNIVTITLSTPVRASGVTAIGFGAPARNTIQNNLTGILLGNGQAAVANTTVSNNTFDGIRITAGTHQIGGVSTRSAASNVIVGNGGFGVVVETTGTRPTAETIAQRQVIRGNYLGVTATDTSTARRNTKGNIGLRYGLPPVDVVYAGLGNRYVPNATTLIDAEGNQHSGTPSGGTGGSGGTGSGGTGSGGRRGVPPLPRRR
jgi:subtilisin-like proprotein convertase family protein